MSVSSRKTRRHCDILHQHFGSKRRMLQAGETWILTCLLIRRSSSAAITWQRDHAFYGARKDYPDLPPTAPRPDATHQDRHPSTDYKAPRSSSMIQVGQQVQHTGADNVRRLVRVTSIAQNGVCTIEYEKEALASSIRYWREDLRNGDCVVYVSQDGTEYPATILYVSSVETHDEQGRPSYTLKIQRRTDLGRLRPAPESIRDAAEEEDSLGHAGPCSGIFSH